MEPWNDWQSNLLPMRAGWIRGCFPHDQYSHSNDMCNAREQPKMHRDKPQYVLCRRSVVSLPGSLIGRGRRLASFRDGTLARKELIVCRPLVFTR